MKIFFYMLYIALMLYFLSVNMNIKGGEWYSREAKFSDWRDKPCDYSTNAIVTQWYNGGHPKYFRHQSLKDLKAEQGVVTIGLDYYTLSPISGSLLPGLPQMKNDWLLNYLDEGGVIVLQYYQGQIYIPKH